MIHTKNTTKKLLFNFTDIRESEILKKIYLSKDGCHGNINLQGQ